MTSEQTPALEASAQQVVEELQCLIRQHYPDAKFEIQRGRDDPRAIHLVTTIDRDDTDAILDLVSERMMDLQIEHDVPVFVIPLRPPERVGAMVEIAQTQRATDILVVFPQP